MIIREQKNVNSVADKYELTMNPCIRRMRDIEGETISFDSYIIYKEDEAANDILSIRTTDGEVYATNSVTFITAFKDIETLFQGSEEEFNRLKVFGGDSKTGRHYITCVYER